VYRKESPDVAVEVSAEVPVNLHDGDVIHFLPSAFKYLVKIPQDAPQLPTATPAAVSKKVTKEQALKSLGMSVAGLAAKKIDESAVPDTEQALLSKIAELNTSLVGIRKMAVSVRDLTSKITVAEHALVASVDHCYSGLVNLKPTAPAKTEERRKKLANARESLLLLATEGGPNALSDVVKKANSLESSVFADCNARLKKTHLQRSVFLEIVSFAEAYVSARRTLLWAHPNTPNQPFAVVLSSRLAGVIEIVREKEPGSLSTQDVETLTSQLSLWATLDVLLPLSFSFSLSPERCQMYPSRTPSQSPWRCCGHPPS